MSIIPYTNENDHELNTSVSRFIKDYKISKLLRICRAEKEKGVPIITVFQYLLCLVFSDRSMYMQIKTNAFKASFSKNTVYRFLNSAKTNWLRFTTLLSEMVVNQFMRNLTSDEREDAFIIDDTLHAKAGYKKSELVSKVFDHVTMKYKKGFRLLTVGWGDGNSFVPINFALLASSNEENVLGPHKDFDKRSVAGRRRKQAQSKATDVLIDLLKTAIHSGHSAKYVLFDTWFSTPKTICQIKNDCKLDVIAMIKKSSRIKYEWNNQKLDVKEIYSRNKKRRGRSKYLLSVPVNITTKYDEGTQISIPAKIVYVRNAKKKKDWIALISTNTELSEEDIIRIYGKRWQTEVFYKTCKSWLKLGKECHGLSYDALTAHVSLVFTRYMLISIEQRKSEDPRSICEIFYVLCDELADITYNESMRIIVEAMLDSIKSIFHITDEQLEEFTTDFVNRLPKYLQVSLGYTSAVA